MKKKFLNIPAFNSRLSEIKKVSIGIITLFISATAPVNMAHAENFYIFGEQETIEIAEQFDPASFELGDNLGSVLLEPNPAILSANASIKRIDAAFEEFVHSQGEEVRELESLKNEIREAFHNVEIQKANVSGRIKEGYLNVSLLLPEKLVLSINSLKDFVEPGVVSFNLFKNRELLVSDIIPLEQLARYVRDVESKLHE